MPMTSPITPAQTKVDRPTWPIARPAVSAAPATQATQRWTRKIRSQVNMICSFLHRLLQQSGAGLAPQFADLVGGEVAAGAQPLVPLPGGDGTAAVGAEDAIRAAGVIAQQGQDRKSTRLN